MHKQTSYQGKYLLHLDLKPILKHYRLLSTDRKLTPAKIKDFIKFQEFKRHKRNLDATVFDSMGKSESNRIFMQTDIPSDIFISSTRDYDFLIQQNHLCPLEPSKTIIPRRTIVSPLSIGTKIYFFPSAVLWV